MMRNHSQGPDWRTNANFVWGQVIYGLWAISLAASTSPTTSQRFAHRAVSQNLVSWNPIPSHRGEVLVHFRWWWLRWELNFRFGFCRSPRIGHWRLSWCWTYLSNSLPRLSRNHLKSSPTKSCYIHLMALKKTLGVP